MNPIIPMTSSKLKTGEPDKNKNPVKLNILRGFANDCVNLQSYRVPPTGVERLAFLQRIRHFLKSQGHRQGQLKLKTIRRGN